MKVVEKFSNLLGNSIFFYLEYCLSGSFYDWQILCFYSEKRVVDDFSNTDEANPMEIIKDLCRVGMFLCVLATVFSTVYILHGVGAMRRTVERVN